MAQAHSDVAGATVKNFQYRLGLSATFFLLFFFSFFIQNEQRKINNILGTCILRCEVAYLRRPKTIENAFGQNGEQIPSNNLGCGVSPSSLSRAMGRIAMIERTCRRASQPINDRTLFFRGSLARSRASSPYQVPLC